MSGKAIQASTRVVLAVTTGVPGLAAVDEVQQLLSFMTGARIFMHQIPRAADVCGKFLQDQHEWLSDAHPSTAQSQEARKLQAWARTYEKAHGEHITVRDLPGRAYTAMDPIVEFLDRMTNSHGAGLAGGNA